MKMCVGWTERQPESQQGQENRSRTTTSYMYFLIFSCHGQRHFKAKIRFEWEQKVRCKHIINMTGHSTQSTPESHMERVVNQMNSKLYNLFRLGKY